MRLFVSFTIFLFCSFQGFSQKTIPVKKTIHQKKMVKFAPPKKNNPLLKAEDIFGSYTILKYYNLLKKSAKKKEVKSFINSSITLDQESIGGDKIEVVKFSIYEIEKMKKDDYLFRAFNQLISNELIELPESFSVHKTNLAKFFGIIQLPNGNIAFPYKGGLIIAKPFPNT